MTSDPRVRISLVTSVYNEELHLDEMIQSVLAQTVDDWELIVVDDGSTDRTCEILQYWASRDPRIRLVSVGKKMGKAAAFSLAVNESTGDLICLAGGDDTLPEDSFSVRIDSLASFLEVRAAAYFKIRTFSTQKRFDGAILPKGRKGSRSGGSITMTRPLAIVVFPIPTGLPSEDIWLRHAVEAVAERAIDCPRVVLNYRIHSGNSNPRHEAFNTMNESLHRRMQAVRCILDQDRFPLNSTQRATLEQMWIAELHRYRGDTLQILGMRTIPLLDRLAVAQVSNPYLRSIRHRVYLLTSGLRGA